MAAYGIIVLIVLNSTFKITDFNMLAKSMEPFVLTLVLIGFIIFTDRPMLEHTSYCAGVEFESPLVYEFIGSSYVSTEFDFNQEYGWLSNLAGKFVRKRA